MFVFKVYVNIIIIILYIYVTNPLKMAGKFWEPSSLSGVYYTGYNYKGVLIIYLYVLC